MNEIVQMVQERHEQLKNSIAKREAEIEKLRAETDKLDTFLRLAKELFPQKSPVVLDTSMQATGSAAEAPVLPTKPRVKAADMQPGAV